MDTPGLRMHKLWQGIHIGRLHLRQMAILQDEARQLVFQGQVFQHRNIGGMPAGFGALATWQVQLVEQNPLELLRRIDVEFFPGEAINSLLEIIHLRLQIL